MSAITVFFGALAGFGFAKYRFPGRTLLFLAVLSTIMVPFQVLVVPLFVEVKWFGWENSYAGLIIPGMMNAFGVFMMRQYAADLPDELIEAARVDGAGEFHIFLRIALPLLLPALASLAIIVFIWSWGNFLWPLVIVQDKDLNVLSVGMTSYSQPYQREPMWARGDGGLDRRDAADRRAVRVLPAVFREGTDRGGGEGMNADQSRWRMRSTIRAPRSVAAVSMGVRFASSRCGAFSHSLALSGSRNGC